MGKEWHEKDGLPPVGEVVEFNRSPEFRYSSSIEHWKDGDHVEVLAIKKTDIDFKYKHEAVVWNDRLKMAANFTKPSLSPIQSERDKLIEKLCDIVNKDDDCRKCNVSIDCSVSQKAVIEAVVNAGWRPKDV